MKTTDEEISYAEGGKGETLLFLHGFQGDRMTRVHNRDKLVNLDFDFHSSC